MTCKPTIHVIDDDQAILDSLSLLLKIEGYAVLTYNSAPTFLRTIKEHACGCVLTDMHMPEMSGLDLLETLKERGISLPVVVISGRGSVQIEDAVKELGAFDYFEKPVDVEALLSSVREALTLLGHENCPTQEYQVSRSW